MGEIARELAPDLFVSLSSDVCPVVGEYERTATTVLNSYVALRVVQYLDRLERRLRRRGFRGAFRVLNSVGGVQSAADAAARPVLLLGSGPTGGVSGSLNLAQALGHQNVITTDMGGTSFDVGLIVEGRPVIAAVTEVGQYHVAEPMVQVRAIGAGGGSLARVVSGMLQVGPQSAGASPGPVCYGRGGEQATVTDADLALGIIDPDTFLGGRMTLDRDAAVAAIDEQIARPLDLDVLEAAAGIRRVVDSQMADALRQVTIGRGHDPREFVLFAYGGAGPTHAADYAAELGLHRVVVPATSMVHSAYGALTSDVLHTAERSVMLRGGGGARPAWDGIDGATIEGEYTRLEQSCLELLERNGIAAAHVGLTRTADVRYRRQTHELIVQYIDGDEAPGERLPRLVERFERAYEDTYGPGSAFREAGIELTTLRVEARGRTVKPRLAVVTGGSRTPEPGRRSVYDPDGRALVPTPIYSWLTISPESSIDGPAVIEHPSTTVVVRRGQRARLDLRRNLVLDLEPSEQ